jgi:hypothetical protein
MDEQSFLVYSISQSFMSLKMLFRNALLLYNALMAVSQPTLQYTKLTPSGWKVEGA